MSDEKKSRYTEAQTKAAKNIKKNLLKIFVSESPKVTSQKYRNMPPIWERV